MTAPRADASLTSASLTSAGDTRAGDIHRPHVNAALVVSLLSATWTTVSAVAAIAIGLRTDTSVLVAFGAVGIVDAVGSLALAYHFRHALRHDALNDDLERIAHRVVLFGLFSDGISSRRHRAARRIARKRVVVPRHRHRRGVTRRACHVVHPQGAHRDARRKPRVAFRWAPFTRRRDSGRSHPRWSGRNEVAPLELGRRRGNHNRWLRRSRLGHHKLARRAHNDGAVVVTNPMKHYVFVILQPTGIPTEFDCYSRFSPTGTSS